MADEFTVPETIRAQQRLIDKRPNDAALHNDLGNLLLLVDDTEGAEAAYRQALAIDPELVSARFNLGLLYQQSHRPGKARREFKQATALDPLHAWAHYQLGVLSAERGRRNAAIESYAKALRLDPRLTDPAYNPHILDNSLAPSATLEAYANDSSADLVPRTYESPRRIAGLMVPELPETMASESAATHEAAADDSGMAPVAPSEPAPVIDGDAADGYEDEIKPSEEKPAKKKATRVKKKRQRPPAKKNAG